MFKIFILSQTRKIFFLKIFCVCVTLMKEQPLHVQHVDLFSGRQCLLFPAKMFVSLPQSHFLYTQEQVLVCRGVTHSPLYIPVGGIRGRVSNQVKFYIALALRYCV